nr:polyadenylate-binding protein-interacting protein 3-like isoform X1 [Ipomoea batatas]
MTHLIGHEGAHEIQPSEQEGTSSFDEDNVKQMLAEEGEKLKPEGEYTVYL